MPRKFVCFNCFKTNFIYLQWIYFQPARNYSLLILPFKNWLASHVSEMLFIMFLTVLPTLGKFFIMRHWMGNFVPTLILEGLLDWLIENNLDYNFLNPISNSTGFYCACLTIIMLSYWYCCMPIYRIRWLQFEESINVVFCRPKQY